MSNETVVSYPQIFSGFSHIGSCREFVWIHHPNAAECRFIMKDLRCGDSFENLMIRKDLFLCSESGEEYVVKDFQLLDISDPNNILGAAGYFGIMTDKFPEVKSSIPLQNAMVSKPTQLLAIRAVSTLISAVESEKAIPTRETREVAAQLIAEIARTPDAVLNLLAVRAYDDYTYAHNVNVATLSLMIGQAMGLSRNDLHSLGVGALLHDIGKLKVAKEILNKIGPLTPREFELIRQHPRVGYEMLRSSREIGEWSKLIVLQHHEKFQGGGYPAGQPRPAQHRRDRRRGPVQPGCGPPAHRAASERCPGPRCHQHQRDRPAVRKIPVYRRPARRRMIAPPASRRGNHGYFSL